jgi:hypothetical protein
MTLFCDHLCLAESVFTLSAYTRHRKEIVSYISEGRIPHLANVFPPGLVVSRTLQFRCNLPRSHLTLARDDKSGLETKPDRILPRTRLLNPRPLMSHIEEISGSLMVAAQRSYD